MTKFFVGLYNYFERHKVLFYLSLSVCILFMALFAAQVRFEENVTSFFPDTKDSQNAINVFENLKIKDKIIIMLSGKDGMVVSVSGNDERIVLTAVFDNLGKGASGAALECLNLVMGKEKGFGLDL